ncbi:hypothetical protein IAR55_003741 [Kwoniella newhampshirensis]|uniref:Uncharacterized protein n=1 Tax=Kwoniella newhampshirensis TaxID=1651941 RepID=A0AAW0YXL6_9TREE
MNTDTFAPPPPYFPTASTSLRSRSGKASMTSLPLHLVHRILLLTLDRRATPSRYWSDPEEERVRRIWGLFRGLRGVNRVFWLVATSILRAMYLETFLSLVQKGFSSDPFPYDSSHLTESGNDGDEAQIATRSVYAGRGRETATFDRFIAIKVGEELRKVESELSEGGEGGREIFTRLQPAARIEDLLLTLSPKFISPTTTPANAVPGRSLPLPQSHLSITLTPTWAQLYLHSGSVTASKRGRKELVVEVRRTETLEGTAKRVEEGLDDLRRRLLEWGGRVG